MARRPSIATKIKRGQGRGEGAGYKPWITINEGNSLGTAVAIHDWKHGRSIQCLSQGEALWYYILRWDDNNIDIREQFPLWDDECTNGETKAIAARLGFKHPGREDWIMTTDFYVTEADGRHHAYAVKPDRDLDDRTLQELCIEMLYWKSRHVPFTILFKEDANRILAANIRIVTEFYDPQLVLTPQDAVKHMIATKQFAADLEHEAVDAAYLRRILMENSKGGLITCQTQ